MTFKKNLFISEKFLGENLGLIISSYLCALISFSKNRLDIFSIQIEIAGEGIGGEGEEDLVFFRGEG